MANNNAVLIMAGGRGTRLWPLSRRDRPKQFLPLVTDRTLLEDTYARVAPLVPPARVFVVAEEELLRAARPLLADVPAANFLAEPAARNTWPCCLWGTMAVAERLGEGAAVLALPADHAVTDAAAFRAALAAGFGRAAAGAVVTFGITPARPDTGYGYLHCGEAVAAGPPRVRRGLAFVEKPDAATAARYLASGDYLWNSGMFVWRADNFLALCAEHCPEDFGVCREMKRAFAAGKPGDAAPLYGRLDATSVDYAFMERLAGFEVVETSCGWDDIGSFDALARILAPDAAGNVAHGAVYQLGGRDNVAVAGGGRPVILLDANGCVVVDAGDVVLVYPKGRGQEVRRAAELMKKERPDLT